MRCTRRSATRKSRAGFSAPWTGPKPKRSAGTCGPAPSVRPKQRSSRRWPGRSTGRCRPLSRLPGSRPACWRPARTRLRRRPGRRRDDPPARPRGRCRVGSRHGATGRRRLVDPAHRRPPESPRCGRVLRVLVRGAGQPGRSAATADPGRFVHRGLRRQRDVHHVERRRSPQAQDHGDHPSGPGQGQPARPGRPARHGPQQLNRRAGHPG